MKYSFWLDMCITAAIWHIFGYSFMGFLIGVVVGTLLSIKIATGLYKAGGVRVALGTVCSKAWSVCKRKTT
jgi:hypothetical protein